MTEVTDVETSLRVDRSSKYVRQKVMAKKISVEDMANRLVEELLVAVKGFKRGVAELNSDKGMILFSNSITILVNDLIADDEYFDSSFESGDIIGLISTLYENTEMKKIFGEFNSVHKRKRNEMSEGVELWDLKLIATFK